MALKILSMAMLLGAVLVTPALADDVRPLCYNGSIYAPCTPSNPMPTASSPAATAVAPTVSSSLESGHVLKASAGSLFGLQVNFVACSVYPCWVMLFDSASLPSNGAVTPKKWYQVSQNSQIADEFIPPLSMTTGATVGCSTTGPFTLTATSQCVISGQMQ